MSCCAKRLEELLARAVGVGRSPSGKAPDFGSGIEGSNPSRPASFEDVALMG
jgi:hypothetical protein